MISIIIQSQNSIKSIPIDNSTILFAAIILFAIYATLYVLRSVGLYCLAKKNSDEKIVKAAGWCFVPVVWVFMAGKLCKKITLFGKNFKDFALLLFLIYAVAEAVEITSFLLRYSPLIGYYLQGGQIYFSDAVLENFGDASRYLYDSRFWVTNILYPYENLDAVNKTLLVLNVFYYFLNVVSSLSFVLVYLAIFKRYWPEKYILLSILCVFFPILFYILVFAIRNRKEIEYEDFLKQRFNGYNPFNSPYGGYNNPYGNNNPYNNRNNDGYDNYGEKDGRTETRPQDEPFSDFNDKEDK